MSDVVPRVHRYGPGPDQFLELTLPDGDRAGARWWSSCTAGSGGRPTGSSSPARSRPTSPGPASPRSRWSTAASVRGGGWPGTLEDVAAAVDCLAALPDAARLDLADVAAVGHSAGGHLAAWLAGRHRLPAGCAREPRRGSG